MPPPPLNMFINVFLKHLVCLKHKSMQADYKRASQSPRSHFVWQMPAKACVLSVTSILLNYLAVSGSPPSPFRKDFTQASVIYPLNDHLKHLSPELLQWRWWTINLIPRGNHLHMHLFVYKMLLCTCRLCVLFSVFLHREYSKSNRVWVINAVREGPWICNVCVCGCMCGSLQGLTRCMCTAVSMGKGLCLISIQSLHRLHQGTPQPASLTLSPLFLHHSFEPEPLNTIGTHCVIKISATGNIYLHFLSC